MDGAINHETEPDSDVIQAELVEAGSGPEWQWRPVRPVARRRRVVLPVLLFAATCVSTFYAGAALRGENAPVLARLLSGLEFAVPLMTLLVCHEMGHFVQAHRYGVYASLPFFIPMPGSPIGTMGAVIAMEPRVGGRRALFDIGISGPLAGLVPTLVFSVWGLHLSRLIDGTGELGEPLLFRFLCYLQFGMRPPHKDILLHPMAFAGWVGLLITSLNLIPIGQLDGGHVLYALLRKKAHRVARFLLNAAWALVILDTTWAIAMGEPPRLLPWTLMLLLLTFLIGPIHPPTADDDEPLGVGRKILGWLTLAFIVIGFTPTPFW
jgi:membrane-associated protease RseP (regulator of RpoE activity)